jgi:uncharacterized protein (DUF427 family)
MTDMKVLVPGPGHPITIDENPAHVTVEHGGRVIADTRHALTLREASLPPVLYVPLADVTPGVLQPSSHTSWCPFKGKATYYDVSVGDEVVRDAVWTYLDPHKAVAGIVDHVAFYADRIDSIEVHDDV